MASPTPHGFRARWTIWLVVAVTIVAVVVLHSRWSSRTTGHHVSPGTCSGVITPQATRVVFDHILADHAAGACTLEGVGTRATRLEIHWRSGDQHLPPVIIVPAGCAGEDAELLGGYQLLPSPVTGTPCRTGITAVRAALRALPPPPAGDSEGLASTWLLRTTGAIFLGALALALYLARRATQRGPIDRHILLLPGGAFALALVARFAVTAAPGNWYMDVLSAAPPVSAGRFGSGGVLYQALLRAVLPWRDTTLFHANAFVGALSVPLFLLMLRERRVPDIVVAAVGVLFAFAPLHVRLSASDSDHVLCSTLHVALLLAWVRAAHTRDLPMAALALLLVPAAALVRVDAWWQLGVVPLWALLVDRSENGAPWRSRARWATVYWGVWAVTGAVLYWAVALPSHHPFPERAGLLLATRQLFSQYFIAAREAPHWISPVAVLLSLPGVVVLARRRPALLVSVLVSLAVAFIPLGRNFLHDGLVGARYFLVTLPISLVAAGYGLSILFPGETPVPSGMTTQVMALSALALATLLPALTAYRYRYTFQDEYLFLRGALTALPDHCTVEYLPIRDDGFDRDMDCCLDVGHSSLAIAFPQLRFATLAADDRTLAPPSGCTVYYETSACSIHETPEVRIRDAHTYARMHRRCDRMRADGNLMPFMHAAVSPYTTNGLFETTSPVVGLYRRDAAVTR